MPKPCLLALLLAAGALGAQNPWVVPGLDGRLSDISSPTYYGRRGAAYPNGEVGMAFSNTMCNPGSVEIPWYAAMQEDHPKFAFLFARVSGGRMVQINDWRSYAKHAFTSVNVSGACGTCQGSSAGGSRMGLRCSDTYGAGNNADRYWLGPLEELDSFKGVWEAVGSWFDLGGVSVTPDGVRSLTTTVINSWSDNVRNRVTLREQDLLVPSSQFFYGIQLIHQGESMDLRTNNIAARGVNVTWNGAAWNFVNNAAPFTQGSILQLWTGASVASADNRMANGTFVDGRFYVAVKVTGPTAGLYRYEYAVHNYDNIRGSVEFAVPVCPLAQVLNAGASDPDTDPLNNWTSSRVGDQLVFSAGANNKQKWNSIYNFWFDSDAAPVAGQVGLREDIVAVIQNQASYGPVPPGQEVVYVPSQRPGSIPAQILGAGCGTIQPNLTANGNAVSPNAAFGLTVTSSPNASIFLFYAFQDANLPLGGGCIQFLDNGSMGTHGFLLTNGAGQATVPLAIPASLSPFELSWQAAQFVPGSGALLGDFNLSHGLELRICN